MEERDFVDKNRQPIGEVTTKESNILEGKYVQSMEENLKNTKNS